MTETLNFNREKTSFSSLTPNPPPPNSQPLHCLRENREISTKKDRGNVFFRKIIFLDLSDGENCSPKIFGKFEVFRGGGRGGGGFYSIFINEIDMFAPKHEISSKATQLKIINLM